MRSRVTQCELNFLVNLCGDGVALCWNWANKIIEVAHVTSVTWPCLYCQHFRKHKYCTFTVTSTLDVSPCYTSSTENSVTHIRVIQNIRVWISLSILNVIISSFPG